MGNARPDLRVLLVSPMPGHDPFNGDVIYTETLLAHPPPGVRYVTYLDALERGELVEHGRRRALERRVGVVEAAREYGWIARNRLVDLGRSRGLLFREPFRHFSIEGDFDLVHCHVYSARWSGRATPLLVSNALPLRELYERARGWSARRAQLAARFDEVLASLTGVQYIADRLPAANGVVAFTETLRSWYLAVGSRPAIVSVAPCSPGRLANLGDRRVPGRVGFVAGDFVAKGGPTLLRAWPEVLRDRPDATLTIAGCDMPAGLQPDPSVTWLGRVPRTELLTDVMPTFDVLAYPSHFDGLPLTLLEALGLGVPAVVSDYFALPEVLGPESAAGMVSREGDASDVAQAIVSLLRPEARAAASTAAVQRFASTYAPEPAAEKLRQSYDGAIMDFGRQGSR